MVVSRAHVENLAAMPRAAVQEYNDLVAQMGTMGLYPPEHLLEAEHGGTEGERGGACITHVHVNLIPGLGHHVDLFDSVLPRKSVDRSLRNLGPGAAPYILLRSAAAVRLYDAAAASSQLIRRALFERLGRDDWDWAAFPGDQVVETTVRQWRALNRG